MNKTTKAASTLAALATLAGCTAETGVIPSEAPALDTTEIVAPAAPAHTVAENLARLRALDVFEVGAMENQIPADANCYGGPFALGFACPGKEATFAHGKAKAERRLEAFANRAERAVAATPSVAWAGFPGGNDLQALRDLHVVEVGELIVSQPETSSCYGFCNATNATRVARLGAIAKAK